MKDGLTNVNFGFVIDSLCGFYLAGNTCLMSARANSIVARSHYHF